MNKNDILNELYEGLKTKSTISKFDLALIFDKGWKACEEYYNLNQ